MTRTTLVVLILLCSCAGSTPAPPSVGPASAPAVGPEHGKRGMVLHERIVDVRTGLDVSEQAVIEDMLSADVVYVGESHDNPHHHEVQLQIIAQLFRKDRDVGVGMEMFEARAQADLDDFLADRIDAETLLSRAGGEDGWGFDFEMYRPFLSFAKMHKVRIYALNAPGEITDQVAKGGLEALSEAEREALPELDLTDEDHRTYVREAFEGHSWMDEDGFERFYTAQVIWDETMASRVAEILSSADRPARLVVLAGEGHVRNGRGIPKRAARRGVSEFRTVMPVMARAEDEEKIRALLEERVADYLWILGQKPRVTTASVP